jgi:cobalamin biosynthesis protein CobT
VQALLATGADVVRRLRRGMANALRSAEKRWWRDDQVRGHLSPRTLYRLCTDRTQLDVFRVRSVVQGRSTAVSVVLDASGSMTSRKMDVARQSMRVLLEALADLKIATEAFTFTTGDRFNLAEACRMTGQDHSQLQTRFSRFGNLEIGLIKRFEEPVKQALRRLPTIRGTGLTPLGEAMQIGASRLSVRRESRRIMLVLTDGRAGCECGDGAAVAHAKHVADLCRKAGIELVNVGIQDESLRAIVADTIVIHQLQDLPAQLCKLLGRALKRGVCNVG